MHFSSVFKKVAVVIAFMGAFLAPAASSSFSFEDFQSLELHIRCFPDGVIDLARVEAARLRFEGEAESLQHRLGDGFNENALQQYLIDLIARITCVMVQLEKKPREEHTVSALRVLKSLIISINKSAWHIIVNALVAECTHSTYKWKRLRPDFDSYDDVTVRDEDDALPRIQRLTHLCIALGLLSADERNFAVARKFRDFLNYFISQNEASPTAEERAICAAVKEYILLIEEKCDIGPSLPRPARGASVVAPRLVGGGAAAAARYPAPAHVEDIIEEEDEDIEETGDTGGTGAPYLEDAE